MPIYEATFTTSGRGAGYIKAASLDEAKQKAKECEFLDDTYEQTEWDIEEIGDVKETDEDEGDY